MEKLENLFQLWTTEKEEVVRLGLENSPMFTEPLEKIAFSVEGKPKNSGRGFIRRRGQQRKSAQALEGPSKSGEVEPPAEVQYPPTYRENHGNSGGHGSNNGQGQAVGALGSRGQGYYRGRGALVTTIGEQTEVGAAVGVVGDLITGVFSSLIQLHVQ
jgi:hypothetical protein